MAQQGGFGVKVRITIASTLTAIIGVREVDLPKFEKVLAESTAHDAAGGYATYIDTGKRMINAFTITVNWDKLAATHAAVITAFNGTTAVNMNVEDPAGQETIAGAAFIKTIGRVAEQEEVYSCEVEIQPTGQWTITP
jgi:hypothetical protein